jgi:membrane protein implicated in regulation of membrane protease activity
MHHLLYVMPLVALALFIFLPFDQALMMYFSILAVYMIFFRVAWKDRRRPLTLGVEGMIGGTARVMENAAGQVKVFYRGEIWDAICPNPVSKDERVEITRVEHMKLVVTGSR